MSKGNQARRNARLAWLSQEICKGLTDTQIILGLMAAFPGVGEKLARAELKEIYNRFADINNENLGNQKVKFLELGFTMLSEMRQNMQYGPAANHFKTMAGIAGVTTEKIAVDQTVTNNTPAPGPDVVRDRITKLQNDPKIRARAIKAGLDIDDLDDDKT